MVTIVKLTQQDIGRGYRQRQITKSLRTSKRLNRFNPKLEFTALE